MQHQNQNAAEFVCLTCTLPECYEGPTCPYWQARGEPKNTKQKSRWASLIEEVRDLEPGGLLVKELSFKDARSAQSSVIWHVREGKITHNITTWRIKDTGLLNILRKSKGG